MTSMDRNMQLNLANECAACYAASSQPERGEGIMADGAVMEILRRIQASIVALDEKTQASLAALDQKFTRQQTILAQDVRLIRAGIQDMVRTRVTAGEVDVLHEDMSRLELGLTALTIRVEALEHAKE
jgi:hypothetical protein